MIVLHYIILCALSTGVASAAHGGNYGRKVFIVILHTLAAPLVAPIFWILFRRGKQAKAELDLFGDRGGYDAVVKAYYIKPLGLLMARVMRYCMENPWPNLGAQPQRIQQELCGGFVLGAILAIPSAILIFLYLHWGLCPN